MKKTILFLTFILTTVITFAQLNYNANSIYMAGTATLKLKDTTTFCNSNPCPIGTVIIALDTSGYVRGNKYWRPLSKKSTGSITALNNGLTLTGSTGQLGGTLIKNTTIAQGGFNTTFTGTGTVGFTPSATLAGINLGSFAGDPSTTNNGDVWYNSTSAALRSKVSSINRSIATNATNGLSMSGSSVILGGTMTTNTSIAQAGFNSSFTGIGTVSFSPTTTSSGLNTGSLAGDPVTTLNNGDIWYNSSTNKFRGRQSGASVDLISSTTPGGSANSVQYNNGGVFGGDASFVWSPTQKTLVLTGTTTSITGVMNIRAVSNSLGAGFPSYYINGSGTAAPTAAIDNIGFGDSALTALTTGSANTIVGINSGGGITSGSTNTILGFANSISNLTTGSHNIVIGDNMSLPTPNGSNQMVIGVSGTTMIGFNGSFWTQSNTTAALDFPSTTAGTSSELTITVTGAAAGDIVNLGIAANAISGNPTLIFTSYVSAANTVTVRMSNISGAAVDPPSGTFKVIVIH